MNDGSANIVLPPLKMKPPDEAEGYLVAANYFYIGAKELVNGSGKALIASAFLAAQSTECALKAYIKHRDPDFDVKKYPIRHDLESLWKEAVRLKLSVEKEPPQWCRILNESHKPPFFFRYPNELNGFSLPDLTLMVSELKNLIDIIDQTKRRYLTEMPV